MKKVIVVSAVLFITGGVIWQWWQTSRELDYLDVRLAAINNDLRQIESAVAKQDIFMDAIVETENNLKLLRKRLPSESNIDLFVQEVNRLCKKHNLELRPAGIGKVEKDFYTETRLTFSYEGNHPGTATLNSIFKEFERIVHWQVLEADQEISVQIYSSSVQLEKPQVKACSTGGLNPNRYWPFGYRIQDSQKILNNLCLKRKENEDVLLQLNRLKKLGELEMVLQHIVQALDPMDTNVPREKGLLGK